MTLREQFKVETNEDAIWEFTTCYSDEIQININYLDWLEEKLKSHNSDYVKCPYCGSTAGVECLDCEHHF